MKTAKELYPEYWEEEQKNGSFYGPCDYQPIIDQFGEILIQVDDEDYQGDSRVLYKDGEKYGYLNFGWGSCSGCDALQGATSVCEIQELIDGLQKDIKWFDDKASCLKYFKKKDWKLDYSYHAEETKDFVEKVIKHLSE